MEASEWLVPADNSAPPRHTGGRPAGQFVFSPGSPSRGIRRRQHGAAWPRRSRPTGVRSARGAGPCHIGLRLRDGNAWWQELPDGETGSEPGHHDFQSGGLNPRTDANASKKRQSIASPLGGYRPQIAVDWSRFGRCTLPRLPFTKGPGQAQRRRRAHSRSASSTSRTTATATSTTLRRVRTEACRCHGVRVPHAHGSRATSSALVRSPLHSAALAPAFSAGRRLTRHGEGADPASSLT